jgi:hypothetical protein
LESSTVIVISSYAVAVPSVALNLTFEYTPDCVYDGVHEKTPVEALNTAFAGKLLADKVIVSPSASVALTVNVNNEFSVTDLFPIAARTGARLLFVTVIDITSESVKLPSVALNRTFEYSPDWVNPGVHEKMPVAVLNSAPDGKLDADSVTVSLSGSEAVTLNVSNVFSATP